MQNRKRCPKCEYVLEAKQILCPRCWYLKASDMGPPSRGTKKGPRALKLKYKLRGKGAKKDT